MSSGGRSAADGPPSSWLGSGHAAARPLWRAARRRRPSVEITELAYDNRAGRARDAVLLRPRLHARRPRLRARRDRPRRGRAGRRAPAGASGVPEVQVPSVARGDGAGGGARSTAIPRRALADRRRHRDQRQDHDGVPGARAARGRRPPDRAARHGQERDRRRRARGPAHDARGDRPPAHVPRDARRRRRGVRDGGLLARARRCTAPTRSTSRRRSSPTSPRTISTSTRTMEEYFGAKRLLFDRPGARARGDQRRRSLRRAAGRGAGRRGDHFALEHDATYRAAERADRPGRLALHGAPPRTACSSSARRSPGASTSTTCSGPSRRPARWASTRTTAAGAIATAGQVPGRFESVDEGQDFAVLVDYAHTPDSLENVLRAARGRSPAGGCTWSSAAAGTATAASAR